MKCSNCDGTGKITEWVATDTVSEYEFPCRKCNGTGEIEVTNEEWFCSLSTEEKAKVLNDIFWKYTNYVDEHEMVDDDITEFYLCWLKEKHHE